MDPFLEAFQLGQSVKTQRLQNDLAIREAAARDADTLLRQQANRRADEQFELQVRQATRDEQELELKKQEVAMNRARQAALDQEKLAKESTWKLAAENLRNILTSSASPEEKQRASLEIIAPIAVEAGTLGGAIDLLNQMDTRKPDPTAEMRNLAALQGLLPEGSITEDDVRGLFHVPKAKEISEDEWVAEGMKRYSTPDGQARIPKNAKGERLDDDELIIFLRRQYRKKLRGELDETSVPEPGNGQGDVKVLQLQDVLDNAKRIKDMRNPSRTTPPVLSPLESAFQRHVW